MTREIEAKDRETDGEMMIFYDEPTEDYGSGKNISSDLMHNEDGNTRHPSLRSKTTIKLMGYSPGQKKGKRKQCYGDSRK